MSTSTPPRGASLLQQPGIFTDYYELTMAQGYFLAGRQEERASFDYFFRQLPFGSGYVVFAGLSDLLDILADFSFHEEELNYLSEQGFRDEFIDYLRNFKLSINIDAAREGEIVFPKEPIVHVEGPIIETQIIETLLLNILNFESLIATKASRMTLAAGENTVIDFGLRRAQGFGGIQASKAAFIGGVKASSNVLSAFKYQIPPSGTMAHSWIQSFDDELTAFRQYAEFYPDSCILLVDTFDTLNSGIPNAITVAKELEERGYRLKGVRLDSGDLAYLSRETRRMFDEAGLDYVKIAASNQLDERLIKSLLTQHAPIDIFGVGTRLVTGQDSPALDGVYKLVSVNQKPKLKLSENVAKLTLPGKKKSMRFFTDRGEFYGDGILLSDEENDIPHLIHPQHPSKHFDTQNLHAEALLQPVMDHGEIKNNTATTEEIAAYTQERLQKLTFDHKRFENPHIYKVGISKKLKELRDKLTQQAK